MSGFDLELELASSGGPVFLRIARALREAIRSGRLRAGERLPGERRLARSLGVHRNTVVAGYAELVSEGWLEARPRRGMFVSASLPEVRPRGFGAPGSRTAERVGFPVPRVRGSAPSPTLPRGVLSMAGGVPDVRLVPARELARAYRRAVLGPATVLGYGDAAGHPALRAALASMLAKTRGLALEAEDVLVTRGSQMALDLVARALVPGGGTVVVESLGYRPAWQAFAAHGARLVPVAVDARGLDVDALAALCRAQPPSAVYLTPHHQYPTTVTLSAARRLALLALAKQYRFAIVEDDYDHEFHYVGRPVLPLASADTAGVVVYVGTLSKILAPGLRIGYVVAPRPLLRELGRRREELDRQGDLAVEAAVAELFEDGTVERHARRARRIYAARREALASAIERELGDVLAFTLPPGGMAFWAGAEGIDVDEWAARALERGVSVQTGKRFAFDGRPRPFLRLGFASLDESEIATAVARLARALPPGKSRKSRA